MAIFYYYNSSTLQINKNIPEPARAERQQQSQRAYGAGAEAKIRATEGYTAKEAAIRAVPVPEGRLRMQEANKFSASLEANMTRSSMRREKSPRPVAGSPKVTKAATAPLAVAAPNPFESNNPFGDVDEEAAESGDKDGVEYDDNLNPFA